MLLPEPATSLGLHSGSALILPCSCPATTLAMLPPLQRASPHPPQPGMSLLSPQASPQGRDARQSLTRGISALDGVVWLWVVLSTTGTPGSLAAFITGADTFPSVSSWWEISPPCERMAVGPARGSAGCHAPSPHLCHGGCFTSHTSMAAAPTRTGQELAFPQGNLCLCMCSGWVLVLSRDSEPSLGQPCLHPHPNPSLSLSPSLSQCLGLCLHFWSHLGGGSCQWLCASLPSAAGHELHSALYGDCCEFWQFVLEGEFASLYVTVAEEPACSRSSTITGLMG